MDPFTTTPLTTTTSITSTTTTTTTSTTTTSTTTISNEAITITTASTTTSEEECHWGYYDHGDGLDHFVTCVEATEEDLDINKCNRVNWNPNILEPGERFEVEGYHDSNCFKFHECIKFCQNKVHKCTFECNCMENSVSNRWMSGIFIHSVQKCIPSYFQECNKNGTLNCDYKLPNPPPTHLLKP